MNGDHLIELMDSCAEQGLSWEEFYAVLSAKLEREECEV